MLIKQVMARPVPTHPKWKYSLNRESMIFFFHKKILYGANVVLRGEKRNVSICGRPEND